MLDSERSGEYIGLEKKKKRLQCTCKTRTSIIPDEP